LRSELEQIRAVHGGILRPEDVVKFARNSKTALHSQFTWDDTEAAKQYRLWQARSVINVCVEILPVNNKEARVYVSLMDDRKTPGGGYRSIVDVMSDADRRAKLLEEACREFAYFREKYKELKELAPLFEAMDGIAKRKEQKRKIA
jgi:hypothetical protein